MSSYDDDADELDDRWDEARNYDDFCHDGILSSDPDGDYFSGERGPRVLYLLKESYGGFTNIRGQDFTSRSLGHGNFWKMLGMWTYVLNNLVEGDSPDLSDFNDAHDDEGYGLANVAYVNIKKEGGRSFSSWPDIRRYARKDRDFLNEQIDLCDPQVIVCCGTYRVYSDIICDGDIPIGSQFKPVYDDYNGRIVIDWRHPSFRGSPDRDFFDFMSFCEKRSEWFTELD